MDVYCVLGHWTTLFGKCESRLDAVPMELFDQISVLVVESREGNGMAKVPPAPRLLKQGLQIDRLPV